MTSWRDKVANRDILIIDGAMGTELERRGVPMHAETWAGAALIEHPDKVRQAHRDYIDAGAEVIITNTFGASPHMLNACALTRRHLEQSKHCNHPNNSVVFLAGGLLKIAPTFIRDATFR